MRIAEVVNLKISNIDSKRMLILVMQGIGKKDRNAVLSPTRAVKTPQGMVAICACEKLDVKRWLALSRPTGY
jgi:integrase